MCNPIIPIKAIIVASISFTPSKGWESGGVTQLRQYVAEPPNPEPKTPKP